MFHIYVCNNSFLLHLTLSLTLSLKNNQVHTFCSAIPFSPPTLFLNVFVLHISLAHQRIVSGWTGGFVVPGSLGYSEGSEPEFASYFGFGKNTSAIYLVFWVFLSVCCSWFWCSLFLGLFCIFANGTIGSPSTLLWFWCWCTGVWLIWFLGFNLYRQLRNLWCWCW